MKTLPDLLENAAHAQPDHGVGFVNADRTVDFISFPELRLRSLAMLAGLQVRGLSPGDVMIISLDKSSEIIPVLWACFQGGIVPALLQPPVTFSEYNPAAEKAEKVYRKLKNPYVILSHNHLDAWLSSSVPVDRLIDIAALNPDGVHPLTVTPGEQDLALIQFSSGSTGDPKGVMLSHRNILTNIRDIIQGIRLHKDDVSVNWMPLFHDMGLIGFHLTPVLALVTQYFIDPVDFVKNPMLWLTTMSERKCTITGCPNFGHLLVNRYLNRRKPEGCDFSPLRVIFNGAEPISVEAMKEFLNGMAPYGLKSEAMFPAYGMAEATLAVSFPELHKGADIRQFDRNLLIRENRAVERSEPGQQTIQLVNLGKGIGQCTFRITDENGGQLSSGMVGQVMVTGENVTSGYYLDPVSTSDSFFEGWLRTGDLGFVHDGNLYITGRAKDIIFINGTNYYAHDLESIAMQLEGIDPGKLVVAGYFDEQERRDRLVIFLVGSDNAGFRELLGRLKTHFLVTIGLSTDIFIPVKSNDIPRTSSGKIQRYKLVERFLKGDFVPVIL